MLKPIRVKSDAEFERLLDHLQAEVGQAIDHWTMLENLIAALLEQESVLAQSNTFWQLTLRAHRDAAVLRLTRLYDKHGSALSLARFLHTVKSEKNRFGQEAFKIRLASSPYVESQAADRAKFDDEQLDQDLESVSSSDPLIKKLLDLRDVQLAHRNAGKVVADSFSTLPGLEGKEIKQLMERASQVVNRYSHFFRASTMAFRIVGHDDYQNLFQYVRKGVETDRQEREA
jgi:hypothetical protein